MSLTIVSAPGAKTGHICIKPYFDSSKSNLGLEKYGMSMHDGVFHDEQLACIERNGVKRYLTGLNEFAPDVKLIKDDDTRNAKIKQIRTIVAQLERELAANVISEKELDDPDFWNKVKLLKPDNDEFWGRINLRCGNQDVILDPEKDPYDLIKIFAIEAGGFAMVSPSYEAARAASVSPKFYLDKYVDTIATKTEVTKLKNKALSELQKMFDKNTNKLFLVAKVVDGNSVQYKKNTPNDTVYDNMDRFINGQAMETNVKRAAQSFIDVCALDMETLKIRAIIRDATFYKFIALKSDGFIYHVESSTMMGRNPSDCLEFLKNPLNDAVLLDISKNVEAQWNR